jgi:hypothetical protein
MKKAKIEQPTWSIDGLKISTWMLVSGALILFIFSGYMWNRYIRGSEESIFWDSMSHALSTSGVEVVADDTEGSNTRKLTIKLDLQDDLSAEARSEYKDDSTNSIIKTVSTKDKDYLYYEKNENSEQPKLKEFEGTWVDISAEGQTESKSLADQLTNGSLILIGNLSSGDRRALVKMMQTDKAFTVLGTRGTVEIAGKSARVYKIRINSVGYNKALKTYLENIGLSEAASQIGDSAASGLEPEVEIAIDPTKRQVVATGFPILDSIGAREYYNWDTNYTFEFPSESINAEELQQRVDALYTPTNKTTE